MEFLHFTLKLFGVLSSSLYEVILRGCPRKFGLSRVPKRNYFENKGLQPCCQVAPGLLALSLSLSRRST